MLALVPEPRAFVFDMDGVIWTMDEPIAGAADAIVRLLDSGARVHYLTNNSSKTRDDYVRKLARFGIPADTDHVMTSAYATALTLRDQGAAGRTVYAIGEAGLRTELEDVGLRVVDDVDACQIDYVVVGWDRQFTYAKLVQAHLAVGRGATFVATNRDATYPDAGGRTLPGGGTLVMALQTCTGVVPRTIGKPEPDTLRLILARAGVAAGECIVVGDRLDTDVGIGKRVGAPTALVLTGVTSRAEVEASAPDQRPDYVWTNLGDMWR